MNNELSSSALQPLPAQLKPGVHGESGISEPREDKEEAGSQRIAQSERPSGLCALNLPTDRIRSAAHEAHLVSRFSPISQDLAAAIDRLSTAESVPLQSVLLSAFITLLQRYTSQDEILIGYLAAATSTSQGCPSDAVVLHINISDDLSVRGLLTHINVTVSKELEHADSRLTPKPDAPQPTVFQVSFSASVGETISANAVSKLQVPPPTADLHLYAQMGENASLLALFYDPQLFDETTIDRMLSNLKTLLQNIADNPDQPLSRLPILTEAEERRIVIEWNQTGCDYPRHKCLHEVIAAQAEREPTKIAVVDKDGHLTYREFNRRANQLAHYLRSRGVGPSVRVAVCLSPSLEFAVAVLAILKSGGACVPLDPKYPRERLAYMLQDVQARLVLTQKDFPIENIPTGTDVVVLAEKWKSLSRQPHANPNSSVTPQDIAYVIYTSGSTGKPRGVLLTHLGLVNYNTNAARMYCIGKDDRVLQFCSISFDIAVEELFITWVSGATLVLRSDEMSLAIPEFLTWITRECITVLDLPTAYWHEWVRHLPELREPVLPKSLRLVIVGGEKASPSAYASWLRFAGHRVRWINTYGPTEATICATAFEPRLNSELSLRDSIPIGRPLANTQVYLLDRHLNPVPAGIPGQLHIGGAGVARGYLNRPELTAEKFISDPFSDEPGARLYKTGDLARYLATGEIEFLGRGDDQVKIRGFRVEIGEVEKVIGRHPAIYESAVVAIEDEDLGKHLVAYFVPRPECQVGSPELREFVTAQLPDYMVPSFFLPLDALPITPNGKVDRRSLPKSAPIALSGSSPFAAPVDELQAELVRIWEDLLRRRPIGIRDNFFEIGGHSLFAARLMHRIGRTFGKTLPLALLFEAPTIEQLSVFLRQDRSSQNWSSVVPIQPMGSRPPFFAVHGVGGNVLGFRELARLMSPDHPFYGLQAQGLDGKRPCFTRVEDMAAHYIEEIKRIQSKGPYLLGGYSFGGLVAFEMAQQLCARGEQVALLVLFDTYPGKLRSVKARIVRLLIKCYRLGVLRDLASTAKISLKRRIKVFFLSNPLKHVFRCNHSASDSYVPRPYHGKTTLLRASEALMTDVDDPHAAWADLTVGGLETQEITGDHGGILAKPQVNLLAAKLKDCIDRATLHTEIMRSSDDTQDKLESTQQGTSRGVVLA